MALNHTTIEKMMAELKCTGDRVTPELIESHIDNVDYQTVEIAGQKFMYCGIRMDNGFVVVGKPAACIDPANWRDEIGRKISYDNAFSEIWRLEAYRKMSSPSGVDIARVAHEVNRAYCQATGDDSLPTWDAAPEWQKQTVLGGVEFHGLNPDATPEDSHNSWLEAKKADGWKYGPKKDPSKKEHPCYVPYYELEESQRAKDFLFAAVVTEMSK